MTSKSQLAITLSKLKLFVNPKSELEQYPTESEVAADVLWNAFMLKDINGKTIADLGAGTGILGIGALELGAKKVYFVEIDEDAVNILNENIDGYENYAIVNSSVTLFNMAVDTVIMNPPFGVQKRKADKIFVESAFKTAKVIYYIGKVESKLFIEAICKEHNKTISHFWKYDLALKKTMSFHTKKRMNVEIGCWRITN